MCLVCTGLDSRRLTALLSARTCLSSPAGATDIHKLTLNNQTLTVTGAMDLSVGTVTGAGAVAVGQNKMQGRALGGRE
jgi:hypothetical protein